MDLQGYFSDIITGYFWVKGYIAGIGAGTSRPFEESSIDWASWISAIATIISVGCSTFVAVKALGAGHIAVRMELFRYALNVESTALHLKKRVERARKVIKENSSDNISVELINNQITIEKWLAEIEVSENQLRDIMRKVQINMSQRNINELSSSIISFEFVSERAPSDYWTALESTEVALGLRPPYYRDHAKDSE